MSELDFGSYLASVYERDIDLLLMEEFHVNPEFARWFASNAGVTDAKFDGVWHSVTDADGETDLLLRVTSPSGRTGILIENKLTAAEQNKQAERYHLRAARAQNEGRFDQFVTAICAPQRYLNALPESSLYQSKVAYEAIEKWFARSDDARAKWRRQIIVEAMAQSRRGYTMIINEAVTGFHTAFWEYLIHNHPRLLMRKPTPKGNKSDWILFKGVGFPKGVGFHIKMDQRCVELGFNRRSVEEILTVKSDWPEDVRVIQKGKTASLSIAVPLLDRTRALADQEYALRAAMAAVERLMPYAHLFDGAA